MKKELLLIAMILIGISFILVFIFSMGMSFAIGAELCWNYFEEGDDRLVEINPMEELEDFRCDLKENDEIVKTVYLKWKEESQ